MGDIINFHDNPVTNIKKELIEKSKELEKTQKELAFFKHIYSSTAASSDLLKLQIADLESTVVILQGHLKLIEDNLSSIKAKLDHIDKMKNRIRTE